MGNDCYFLYTEANPGISVYVYRKEKIQADITTVPIYNIFFEGSEYLTICFMFYNVIIQNNIFFQTKSLILYKHILVETSKTILISPIIEIPFMHFKSSLYIFKRDRYIVYQKMTIMKKTVFPVEIGFGAGFLLAHDLSSQDQIFFEKHFGPTSKLI